MLAVLPRVWGLRLCPTPSRCHDTRGYREDRTSPGQWDTFSRAVHVFLGGEGIASILRPQPRLPRASVPGQGPLLVLWPHAYLVPCFGPKACWGSYGALPGKHPLELKATCAFGVLSGPGVRAFPVKGPGLLSQVMGTKSWLQLTFCTRNESPYCWPCCLNSPCTFFY